MLKFTQWCSKLGEGYSYLCSFFRKYCGSVLIDGAEEFVFLTNASGASSALVTKLTFGNLYQTTKLVTTTETMLSILFFNSL